MLLQKLGKKAFHKWIQKNPARKIEMKEKTLINGIDCKISPQNSFLFFTGRCPLARICRTMQQEIVHAYCLV